MYQIGGIRNDKIALRLFKKLPNKLKNDIIEKNGAVYLWRKKIKNLHCCVFYIF